jgi:hypothetical protein
VTAGHADLHRLFSYVLQVCTRHSLHRGPAQEGQDGGY